MAAEDSGTYQCTAVDDRGRSAKRTVRVVVKVQDEDAVTSAASNTFLRIMIFLTISFGRKIVNIS